LNHLKAILQSIAPITLEEMDQARLMSRIDTKYAFPARVLPELLQSAGRYYRLLTVAGTGLSRYRTLYFDSPEYSLYHAHHNGYRPRFKVRFREYTETGTRFFEVKEKNNKNRTIKHRIPADGNMPSEINDPYLSFMRSVMPEDHGHLGPVLWSTFTRITLVDNSLSERITIDIDPGWSDDNKSESIPKLVIAEVKKDTNDGTSEFAECLKSWKIYPASLSKYCLGIVLLKDNVKTNLFKEKINLIKKLDYAD